MRLPPSQSKADYFVIYLGDVLPGGEKLFIEVGNDGFGAFWGLGLGDFRQGPEFIFYDRFGHQFEFELVPIPVVIVGHADRISRGWGR